MNVQTIGILVELSGMCVTESAPHFDTAAFHTLTVFKNTKQNKAVVVKVIVCDPFLNEMEFLRCYLLLLLGYGSCIFRYQ